MINVWQITKNMTKQKLRQKEIVMTYKLWQNQFVKILKLGLDTNIYKTQVVTEHKLWQNNDCKKLKVPQNTNCDPNSNCDKTQIVTKRKLDQNTNCLLCCYFSVSFEKDNFQENKVLGSQHKTLLPTPLPCISFCILRL